MIHRATCLLLCVLCGEASAAVTPVAEAERLAAAAIALAATSPEQALAQARKALALTADFEPTAFVKAGRKGEVVEDEYLAARNDYRQHRSRLYEAVGEALGRLGRHDQAVRYLRRAADLDPKGGSLTRLARSLVVLGRGRPALDVILSGDVGGFAPESVVLAEAAADAIGLPSLQVEIDRIRVQGLMAEPRPVYRDGPLKFPDKTHLSTGQPFRLDQDGLALLYVADPTCRSCSADLEAVKRLAPAGVRVVVAPAVPDKDAALRQALALYRYDWPVLVGQGTAESLGFPTPAVVFLARRGWVVTIVRPQFAMTLPPVLEVLSRTDVKEPIPRAAWNRRPPERRPGPPPPALLPEGIAPGEDEPPPEPFVAAVAAFREGKAAVALRLFESLDAAGDGWLLPPEARLDRALCLAALGRRDEARLLLLKTGDSRFQEAVDRTLERVGSPPSRKK